MTIYTFACAGCGHTFRRILSEPKATVPCPLCGAEADLEGLAAPSQAAVVAGGRATTRPPERAHPMAHSEHGPRCGEDDEDP